MVVSQILLDDVQPRDAGRPGCLLQSARVEANRILLDCNWTKMYIVLQC